MESRGGRKAATHGQVDAYTMANHSSYHWQDCSTVSGTLRVPSVSNTMYIHSDYCRHYCRKVSRKLWVSTVHVLCFTLLIDFRGWTSCYLELQRKFSISLKLETSQTLKVSSFYDVLKLFKVWKLFCAQWLIRAFLCACIPHTDNMPNNELYNN